MYQAGIVGCRLFILFQPGFVITKLVNHRVNNERQLSSELRIMTLGNKALR